MVNQLDEMTGPVLEDGRNVNVIAKQIPVKVGVGSTIFQVILWILVIPGIIFLFMKINAAAYLRKLEQKIQHDASQIDNYLEQRVVILQNCARLVDKAVELDKSVMTDVAAYRAGQTPHTDAVRNEIQTKLDGSFGRINLAFENYPELRSHQEIADAMQQNSYLQKEITAAREVYNDTVNKWNSDIQSWPTKMIVAAKQGYTTRVPFSASKETKEAARGVFF